MLDASSLFLDRIGPAFACAWKRLLDLHHDRRGVTAVEFGLVAVPFIGMMAAIFELGLVTMYSEGLEAAVQEASRKVLTGEAQASTNATAAKFVNAYLCPASGRVLPSFFDCSKLIVDIRTSTGFSGLDTSNDFYKSPTAQQFCLGGTSQIVIVRVAYPMPVFLPLLGTNGQITAGLVNDVPNDPGWKHLLLATAVFQTEPFPASTYSAAQGC